MNMNAGSKSESSGVVSNRKPHKISLLSATALSATAMVGSGWLFSAQLNAKLAGNYAFLAWLFAAILVMGVGLCISQVVSVFPVRGVITRSSALSHNNVFGMPFAFANWFGIMVTIATEAQATTQYLSAAMKNSILMDNIGLTTAGKLVALFILLIYLAFNYYGIKLMAKINNVMTALKIFTPLFTIVMLLLAHFDKSNFALASTVSASYTWQSAFIAIVGAGLIYSYNGFQLPAAFASEIKDPTRNVPLSIVISLIIVMGVYMFLQLAFMGAVPHHLVSSSGWASLNFNSPLMNLALLLGINFLALLLIADSIVSPSGTGYSYLGAASRMLYAMAAERQMPTWIAKLDPVYNFSKRSMLINFLFAALVLWNSDSWASLMVVVTGYHLIGYMAAPISMSALKPKTKLFGMIVFVLLGLTMTTIPGHDMLMMNISIMILLIIYSTIQLFTRSIKLSPLFVLNLPFTAYLWLVYFSQNLIFVGIISALFFMLISSTRYVKYCKAHKGEQFRPLNDSEDSGEKITPFGKASFAKS